MNTITDNYVEDNINLLDLICAYNVVFEQDGLQIKGRVLYGVIATLAPLICTINSISGFFFGIGAVLTGGTNQKLNRKAIEFSRSGGKTLHYVFRGCLGIIRPGYLYQNLSKTVTTTQEFCAKVDEYTSSLIQSDSKLKQHVLSRVIFFSAGIFSVFTTINDLAMGILMGFGALLALGQVDRLNALACTHLKESISAPIYKFLIKTLNVHAKFDETDQ